MSRIKSLEEANIAIVAMGESQLDYHLSKSHSIEFDEVWGINAMAGITECDRVFMMDPASRFLDSDDAGSQTGIMVKTLKSHPGPIYTCELDSRCKGLVEYPLLDVVKDTRCSYFNNTVPFAIAFALYNRVSRINLFGVDFTYRGNLHFAEAGRSCVEFWLANVLRPFTDAAADLWMAILTPKDSTISHAEQKEQTQAELLPRLNTPEAKRY